MLFAEDRIQINRWARAPQAKDTALQWFASVDDDTRKETLRETGMMATQAGCSPGDVVDAAQRWSLPQGCTPCVLMSKPNPRTQLAKVLTLPKSEWPRSFALLLALLSVADDRRRRTQCQPHCSHWWHQNLGSADVVRSILESGEAGRRRE